MSIAVAVMILTGLLLLAAALHDVAARTIPNAIPLLIAILGLTLRLLEGTLLLGLIAGLIVFTFAFLAWRYGAMGGGDVKLLGACALVAPPAEVHVMVLSITLVGGVLSLFYLTFRGRRLGAIPARTPALFARVWRAEIWRLRRGGPLPYAVAIFGGTVLTIAV